MIQLPPENISIILLLVIVAFQKEYIRTQWQRWMFVRFHWSGKQEENQMRGLAQTDIDPISYTSISQLLDFRLSLLDMHSFHRSKEKEPQLKMFDNAPVFPAVPPVVEAAVRFISLNESVIPEEDYLKDLGDV